MELKSILEWISTNRKRLLYVLVMKSNIKFTLVWLIFVAGSFSYDFLPLPQSYFSNRRNFFNVVFAKRGWGWTSVLLTAYLLAILLKEKVENQATYYKHLSRVLVLTVAWYTCTTLFEIIENFTGSCLGDQDLISKHACYTHGSLWNGFDISGHGFLLTFCILIVNEELHRTITYKTFNERNEEHRVGAANGTIHVYGIEIPEKYVSLGKEMTTVALVLLMVIWEVMLFFTCAYFHTLLQKLLGVLIGYAAWYVSYEVVFKLKNPLTPCEPSQITKLNRD